TGAGLAVPDFPLAYGSILPSLSPDAIEGYTRSLVQGDILIAADGPVSASQITIHLLHRYWGILTGVLLFWTAHRLFHSSKSGSARRTLGLVIAALTTLQIA